jgi:hypothetical protein
MKELRRNSLLSRGGSVAGALLYYIIRLGAGR